MKKLLIFMLLSFASIGAYAQAGTLDIKNNTACTLHITMYGIAPTTGDNCFDLISSSLTLGPLSGLATDYCTITWAIASVPITCSSTDFEWASMHFTFSGCPMAWGCTPLAGNMGDGVLGCTGTMTTYSSSGCGPVSGSWNSPGSGTPLANVAIDFH